MYERIVFDNIKEIDPVHANIYISQPTVRSSANISRWSVRPSSQNDWEYNELHSVIGSHFSIWGSSNSVDLITQESSGIYHAG